MLLKAAAAAVERGEPRHWELCTRCLHILSARRLRPGQEVYALLLGVTAAAARRGRAGVDEAEEVLRLMSAQGLAPGEVSGCSPIGRLLTMDGRPVIESSTGGFCGDTSKPCETSAAVARPSGVSSPSCLVG